MSECTAWSPTPPDPRDAFLALLPTIRSHAAFRVRRLPPEAREEALQEMTANAYVAFARLARQGRTHAATGTSLARYAAGQFFGGRRVGSRQCVRDVMSPYCHRQKGVEVRHLHRWDERDMQWRELLVEDRHASPAEIAATRLDFAAWLRTLPGRLRRIALTLATGETTGRVARRFRVSAARISQLRREFAKGWERFHADRRPRVAGATVKG